MIIRAKRYTRGVFLSVLRQYFASHNKFPWQQNILKTKLLIEENFPSKPFSMPCIIVENTVANKSFEKALERGLVEHKYEDTLINGVTRSTYAGEITIGKIDANTPIAVFSIDPFVGEMIADEIITLLNLTAFEKFRNAGLEIVDLRDSNPVEVAFGNDIFFKFNLDVSTYQEWENNITPEELDVIEKIQIPDINGLIVLTPDGITNPIF
jgi:hypothetical protein